MLTLYRPPKRCTPDIHGGDVVTLKDYGVRTAQPESYPSPSLVSPELYPFNFLAIKRTRLFNGELNELHLLVVSCIRYTLVNSIHLICEPRVVCTRLLTSRRLRMS